MSNYVVLDIETTGLQIGHHEISQIAAVIYTDQGTFAGSFMEFVRPDFPERADPKALQINGTNLEFLSEQGSQEAVKVAFLQWLKANAGWAPHLITYNGNNFDRPMLEAWGWKYDWNYVSVDVLEIVRGLMVLPKHLPNGKLTTLTDFLKIEHKAHDALGDVRATWEVYQRFVSAWTEKVLKK